MTFKSIKNQHGFTMVELFISMAIMGIVLGGTIMVFTEQQTRLKDENDTSKVRAKGRHAIKLLAREVRMAGFGLPPGLGLTNAASDTISYDVNLNNDTAYADINETITGNSYIKVTDDSDIANFSNTDKAVVYNPNTGVSELVDVTGTATKQVNFSGPILNTFVFGTYAKTTTINKYLGYVIQLTSYTSGGRTHYKIERIIDGTETRTLVYDVAPGGLTFLYFDKDGGAPGSLADIQRVQITLNMLDPKNPDAVMKFVTDVQIRNSNL
jgi:prepilin-type N-terminal cleavage/methylation domain-containing protein